MKPRIEPLLALLFALVPSLPAQTLEAVRDASFLSPQERGIVQQVDTQIDEGLALLERVVNINSGTMNFDGVRRVGAVFQAEFEALGFETRWIDGAPFNRAGHLVAERRGAGTRFLLIGHLDTVFEPDSPFQRFERVGSDQARGPGVTDMKGGDVIIVQILKALASVGRLDGMDITVVLTGDEEKSGRPLDAARRDLVEAARRADVALGFEDGDGDPRTAVISRRGSASWTVRVKGTPSHSSQIFQPDVGAGAIFEAARVLDGFRQRLQDEPLLSFNPGVILGGTSVDFDPAQARGAAFGKENVVAGDALVTGDLRCISPEQLAASQKAMREVVAHPLPGTSSEIRFHDGGYPPMAPTEGNRRLLELYDQASRDLGLGPVTAVDPRNAGAADISFAADHVPMSLDGLGLMGKAGHTVGETADLATLASQTKRAALLIFRLAR